MDVAAKVTSKGQMTSSKPVPETLGLVEGDRVVFRVDEKRAVWAVYLIWRTWLAPSRSGGRARDWWGGRYAVKRVTNLLI